MPCPYQAEGILEYKSNPGGRFKQRKYFISHYPKLVRLMSKIKIFNEYFRFEDFGYIAVCGFVIEFIFGWAWKFVTGEFLYIYPNSFLVTSSLLIIPFWGLFGALMLGVRRYYNDKYKEPAITVS